MFFYILLKQNQLKARRHMTKPVILIKEFIVHDRSDDGDKIILSPFDVVIKSSFCF